jgi:hypothetical protein
MLKLRDYMKISQFAKKTPEQHIEGDLYFQSQPNLNGHKSE